MTKHDRFFVQRPSGGVIDLLILDRASSCEGVLQVDLSRLALVLKVSVQP
ncbi:hypothetical protein C4K33_4373 [Pseudomonas chlororaphis subsp. piscium]|nr:hypothetical protein C4K33_4373 [Pseudomonas chlororaphis subsp. piscium]AZC83533.1 hypothetical protein C4K30_4433 [Pseudomonas chlororaphis subsp. piscium]